jgi:16S rRNA (cytidine1402-2'-O)-methyltransferase
MSGTLYLVATPIGNLEDITLRALRLLAEVNTIACEDTRRTRILLDHYQIKTKLISYHEHNERDRALELVERLASGESIALVSDAGTPAISDPGFRLVRAAIERGLEVTPIPGAAAFVSALIASGLPTDEFFFGGFLPSRSTARRSRLTAYRTLAATLVFYESPHRIAESLKDAHAVLGEREAAVAREITKLHEEIHRGRLSELVAHFAAAETHARGEIVLLIDRTEIAAQNQNESRASSVLERITALKSEGHNERAAMRIVAREMNLARDEVYRRLAAEKAVMSNG